MSAADDIAALEGEPTAKQIRDIFAENDLPLTIHEGKIVAPSGITPRMGELLAKHEAALVKMVEHAEARHGDAKVQDRHVKGTVANPADVPKAKG